MAGLNTKSGQRNAPSPYSAPANKAPVPKQNPGGGTTLENQSGVNITLKPKRNTSEISAVIPVSPLDEMRRKEKEDTDYYSKLVGQIQNKNMNQADYTASRTADTNAQAAEAQAKTQMEMAKFQGTQRDLSNYSAAINQIRTNNMSREAANAQNQALADRQREEIGYKTGADLRTYYADVLKTQSQASAAYMQSQGARNQNYQYWG